jgi:hypothetical protein
MIIKITGIQITGNRSSTRVDHAAHNSFISERQQNGDDTHGKLFNCCHSLTFLYWSGDDDGFIYFLVHELFLFETLLIMSEVFLQQEIAYGWLIDWIDD